MNQQPESSSSSPAHNGPADDTALVKSELDQGVLSLTLNRPERLNSFTPEMHRQLAVALERAEADDAVRCVLLTGAGRAFCAGQDLSNRQIQPGDAPPDLGLSLEQHYNPLIRRLTTLPKPTLAVVNGVAAGAGVSLALACDITVAAHSARFIFAFSRIGLVPDSGASWFLPRRVGHARASAIALLGETLTAAQAQEWGLIWQALDDELLARTSRQLAQQLATQATTALGMTKRALLASASQPLDPQLDLERDLQRLAGRSEDYREGVAAFFAKRHPHFHGR